MMTIRCFMSPSEPDLLAPEFQAAVERLHELTLWWRWFLVIVLWITVGGFSLWILRGDISLLKEHFTWASVRYALAFNRGAAIGLGLCLGMTLAVLMWQTRNILWGRPQAWQKRLERRVWQIRLQGSSHPLWRWVCAQK